MNLLKKIIAIGLLVFCIGGSIATASSGGLAELDNAIKAAQIRYAKACENLKPGVMDAAYSEYINAKAALDDLLYLRYMAAMNEISTNQTK